MGDFLTLWVFLKKVESPLLVKAAHCVRWAKTGWGVTWITSWIWTRFEPAVSEAYGNHAVMNCCLLCSLQGAPLNILQWIRSHRDVTHARKRAHTLIHTTCSNLLWLVWQVTSSHNNVALNIQKKDQGDYVFLVFFLSFFFFCPELLLAMESPGEMRADGLIWSGWQSGTVSICLNE